MKRYAFLSLALAAALLLGCGGCNSASVADALYGDFLDTLRTEQPNAAYAYHDMDGNRTPELLVKNDTAITVYTHTGGVTQIGTHDFSTGTLRLLTVEQAPGLVCFTVGGGLETYQHFTLKDGELSFEHITAVNFSGLALTTPPEHQDKALVRQAKEAYRQNRDLAWIALANK